MVNLDELKIQTVSTSEFRITRVFCAAAVNLIELRISTYTF